MLPPCEDFVMVDMDLMMNSVDAQTPDQVVEENLASKGKVKKKKKKAVKKRAAEIQRILLAKSLSLNVIP